MTDWNVVILNVQSVHSLWIVTPEWQTEIWWFYNYVPYTHYDILFPTWFETDTYLFWLIHSLGHVTSKIMRFGKMIVWTIEIAHSSLHIIPKVMMKWNVSVLNIYLVDYLRHKTPYIMTDWNMVIWTMQLERLLYNFQHNDKLRHVAFQIVRLSWHKSPKVMLNRNMVRSSFHLILSSLHIITKRWTSAWWYGIFN